MKVTGLIAEFNPLHRGHEYIIKKAKENADVLIVVLSGSFTQRGEPVVVNKFDRAKDAISAGADLVIAHPVYTATSFGDFFAEGGISTLLKCPNVSKIVCGGEISDLNLLESSLKILESSDFFPHFVQPFLDSGESYSTSYRKALEKKNPEFSKLFQSNMILAMGYGKALYKRNALHLLEIIPRIDSWKEETLVSASEIRKNFNKNPGNFSRFCVGKPPQYSLENLMETLYSFSRFHFFMHPISLHSYDGYEIGIENRLMDGFSRWNSYDSFRKNIPTKRYSLPRIQRLILHSLLNLNHDSIQDSIQNQRVFQVLAFNEQGQRYLKIARNSDVTFLTNFKSMHQLPPEQKKYLEKEKQSSDLWALLTNHSINLDFKTSISPQKNTP
ncbi:nucleotidyltransferase family protein [Peptoniphilus sp. KCTC 25270]|uniref:nucleotidyltransferase family protein n=1 Tax=Peptoniphilus sp. KCTC 25270 TaxID=2897414 RepID=UPI001E546084|nr:nucleotidyltransferase family protein [Peptoniphilus sp. KCTC 25270]MCD1147097.1 nucleotidyltransferase family protein [Peptoniphilus sp. KCTC 25270]